MLADMHDLTDPFQMPVKLRRELLREGWHDRAIAEELRAKRWVRPRRGAYVDTSGWDHLDEAGRHVVITRAVVRRANTRVVVSHSSSVPWWGGPTWGLDLRDVHTTRFDGKPGRCEAGVHQHCGAILDDDIAIIQGHEVMAAARTALEVTTVASTEVGLIVLNDFLHRELTTPADVRVRYDLNMEHWPASRATDLVIRLADPRLQSVLESRFLYFCFRIGLPAPTLQYEVHTHDGHLVAELDFAWPELGAYVETHGKAKYLQLLKPNERPGDVIGRERRREELVHQLTGFRALHVEWADLDRPRLTEQRLRNHLWPIAASAG
jgi:hypothetical protein